MTWDDVQIKTGWRNRKKELRVHCSLKGASFVGHTFWLPEWTPDKPETRAAVLLVLNRELDRKRKALEQYTQ